MPRAASTMMARRPTQLVVALLAVTIGLVLVFGTVLLVHEYITPIPRIKSLFNINGEANLPAWWNSALLMTIGFGALVARAFETGAGRPPGLADRGGGRLGPQSRRDREPARAARRARAGDRHRGPDVRLAGAGRDHRRSLVRRPGHAGPRAARGVRGAGCSSPWSATWAGRSASRPSTARSAAPTGCSTTGSAPRWRRPSRWSPASSPSARSPGSSPTGGSSGSPQPGLGDPTD